MNSFLICLTAFSMNLHNAEVICKNSANIVQEAEINKIKPSLIIAVGTVESRWTPKRNKTIALCGYNAGYRCKGENKNKQGLKYAKAVLKWERKFDKAYRKQKGKYKNKSTFNYLFWLVKNIGDYK